MKNSAIKLEYNTWLKPSTRKTWLNNAANYKDEPAPRMINKKKINGFKKIFIFFYRVSLHVSNQMI